MRRMQSTKPQPQLMPALALTESRGARLVAAHLRIAAMARLARLIPSDADRTRLSRSPWAMILPTSRVGNGAQDEADLSASHDDFRDATHALHTLEHAHSVVSSESRRWERAASTVATSAGTDRGDAVQTRLFLCAEDPDRSGSSGFFFSV
jgi:hypothetical protein